MSSAIKKKGQVQTRFHQICMHFNTSFPEILPSGKHLQKLQIIDASHNKCKFPLFFHLLNHVSSVWIFKISSSGKTGGLCVSAHYFWIYLFTHKLQRPCSFLAAIMEGAEEKKNKVPAMPEMKLLSLTHVWLFVTPRTVACQALLSMAFSRQEYWSGLPFPSPGYFPDPEITPRSPALQADSLLSEPLGPETFKKKQKNFTQLKIKYLRKKFAKKILQQARRNLIYETTKHYHKEYRQMYRNEIQMARMAGKAGNFYVPVEPKWASVIRVRVISGVSPEDQKVLWLINICQIFNSTFMKLNKVSNNMLIIVEPYIARGIQTCSL